ncbi:cytochrome C [Photobacterium sp. NCIMB 13483]|uniref:Cytochrome c-552 n=1 Tax=Photobacterium piscicola TaxID=1378299 RepID=A0A1T5I165_9GAMM|nr:MULTISPECIES: c-type cytochrome [Photobacterium]PST85931.1 cytochrome C [Photobacterium sp. NCIMB 13483]SKC32696.1 Cytochrome c-552 [Photobacterium piscicola]
MTQHSFVRFIFTTCTFLCSIAVTATESNTETQYLQGKEKSVVCMTCHGVDGISTIDTYPNLQGQKQAYFVAALKAYKLRQRNDGLAILMHAQADVLSEQDMLDIAYYFNHVKSKSTNDNN